MDPVALLDWINQTCELAYEDYPQLCDGIAGCILLNRLYPDVLDVTQMVPVPKTRSHYRINHQLIIDCLKYSGDPSRYNIDSLVSGEPNELYQIFTSINHIFAYFLENGQLSDEISPMDTKNQIADLITRKVSYLQSILTEINALEEERNRQVVMLNNVADLIMRCKDKPNHREVCKLMKEIFTTPVPDL